MNFLIKYQKVHLKVCMPFLLYITDFFLFFQIYVEFVEVQETVHCTTHAFVLEALNMYIKTACWNG